MRKNLPFARAVATVLLLLANTASAWGPEGHRIAAHIAERRLSDKAREALIALLPPDQQISDNLVCNWPDYIRHDEPQTAPWHYVDIPFDAIAYDAARDCTNGQCVVEQIGACEKILADTNASVEAKSRALKFAVHFVGDLHQPLHCISRDDDRGGNLRSVLYPKVPEETNLHSVWDSNLVRANLKSNGSLDYADKLNDKISGWQARRWSRGTVADWASEGREVAVTQAYDGVPPTGGPPFPLPAEYVKANRKVVDRQLMKAGVRLAAVLNRSLN